MTTDGRLSGASIGQLGLPMPAVKNALCHTRMDTGHKGLAFAQVTASRFSRHSSASHNAQFRCPTRGGNPSDSSDVHRCVVFSLEQFACQYRPMEFREVIARRKMIRSFTDEPVSPEALQRILESGRHTGSAGNTHGTSVLVLDSPETRTRFWECTGKIGGDPKFPWPELPNAPVILLPLADATAYHERYRETDKARHVPEADLWRIPFWYLDSGFAIQNMLLAATDEGLGAVFFGVFGAHVGALITAFEIDPHKEILGAIAIGQPSPNARPSLSAQRGRPAPETFAIRPR